MEWDNPAENHTCKNSGTEPTRQLTGSSWRLPHQEVKVHFKEYTFLLKGALDWRMITANSVERPELMSCAPSGATSTVPKTLGGGKAPPEREEIPPDGNLPWRAIKKGNQVREAYSACPDRGYPSGTLSPEFPGAVQSGKAYRQSLGQVCFQMSSTTSGWSLHPPGAPASRGLNNSL